MTARICQGSDSHSVLLAGVADVLERCGEPVIDRPPREVLGARVVLVLATRTDMAAWRGCAGDREGEAVSGENGAGGEVGLVLGGGGARGAYASGVLSVLLPELKDQVRVIVGTSAGALISAYLVANWHRPVKQAIEDGLSFWRDLNFGDVCAPLMAVGGATRFMRYVGEFLPVRSMHGSSILHPEPLPRTLARLVDFDQLGENIREQRLALGVVAAPPMATGRSCSIRAGFRDTARTPCVGSSTSPLPS